MLMGMLEVYTQKDFWTAVTDNTVYDMCKKKWDQLGKVYGGIRSMSTFNSWVALTRTTLGESFPMLPQLQKLNKARMNLHNNQIEINNLQFCFIMIKALPKLYSAVALTILASVATNQLKPLVIKNEF